MGQVTAAELSRPIRLDTLGEGVRGIALEADAAERAALARRFDLVAIDRLTASCELRRDGDVVMAAGDLAAAVVQACVASGADVVQHLAVPFALRFVPEREEGADEVELGEGELDDIEYAGGAVDIGEAVAQTLALSLDPFPRAPDADAALREAGVVSEEEAGPFAALKGLRDRLAR